MVNYDKLHQQWDCIHFDYESPTYQLRKKTIFRTLRQYVNPKNHTALDVGCGTGDYTIELATMGFQITGIDISSYAINTAKEKCEKLGITNACFQQTDIMSINSNQKYDFILLSEVLEHCEDDLSIFKNLTQILNPGGYLLCSVPFDPDLWSYEYEDAGHVRRYDTEGINQLLLKGSNVELVEKVCYGYPLLRVMWILKRQRKKVDTPFKGRRGSGLVRALLKILSKFVVTFDSLKRSAKGVGIVFLVKKL